MQVEEAEQKIIKLKKFIQMIREYEADGLEQEAVYLYVQLESVTKVAVELNKKEYKVGNRKVISKDVSDIIRGNPVQDEMHELAKRMFQSNKSRSSKRGWI